jgi:hypothetical protein
MSQATRDALVQKLVFQDISQKTDLQNPAITQTGLIEMLMYLVQKGHHMEITAVKSDHHNDSALGLYCHFNGYCVDLWPLASVTPGDYLDATNPYFQTFLKDVASSPVLYQIGLAGSAVTRANILAAGITYFQDDGGDHVHIGTVNP